jgi:HTH-type transcriptional regulator, sugar sensing transcriptional regulator
LQTAVVDDHVNVHCYALSMIEPEEVVQSLQAIGMSGYEAKAYLALVGAHQPINGYEVAKRSGVPRSTVYETLGKLLTRGAAFEVRSADDSTSYVALPWEALIRRLRHSFESHLDDLADALPRVAPPPASHLLHAIEGKDAVIERARDVIDLSVRTLDVSAWSVELQEFTPALQRAESRGVDISIICFGEEFDPIGHTQMHMFAAPEVVLERVGCRLIVVAADRKEVLIGGIVDGGGVWGVFSDDPAVVLVAVEYIRHDIAFQILVAQMGIDAVEHVYRTDPTLLRLATGRGAPGLDRRASPS